jgi:hypothetical protein
MIINNNYLVVHKSNDLYQSASLAYCKLLNKSQGIPLIFTRFCKSTLLSKQSKLERWNRTQETPALIATAWRAAFATLEYVTERWKTLKSLQMWPFYAASAFLPQQVFWRNNALKEHWNLDIKLSTGTSISINAMIWVHPSKTTWWLDDKNWACWTECFLTFFRSVFFFCSSSEPAHLHNAYLQSIHFSPTTARSCTYFLYSSLQAAVCSCR